MSEVTVKTEELLREWLSANHRVRTARRELNSAECAALNATNNLGRWLVPPDANEGEEFNLWFGSGVLRAKRTGQNDYTVDWRKEPDDKQGLEKFGHLLE